MDWHVPLESFGGEDSLSVGTRALECHKSQVGGRWNMNTGVKYQNNVFGLFYTTVGDDVACNDLMEHVVLNKNSDSQFLDDTVQEDET